jgi:hypothetical protein
MNMQPVLARCGYRCDLCLAYQPNVQKDPSSQQVLSDGWYKYFGFRIPPEQILCDGCLSADSKTIDQNCLVRPCVIAKGLNNCAGCEDYACENLGDRLVVYEEMAARFADPIPQEDRRLFILPYENKQRLEKLRATNR